MLEQAKAWVKAQYWSRRDHRSASAGTADAGLPAILNSRGKLGGTLVSTAVGRFASTGSLAEIVVHNRATDAASVGFYSPTAGIFKIFDYVAGADRFTIAADGKATLPNTLSVPGAINDEKFALDTSGSTISLTAGQSLPISASGAFSGLVILIDHVTTGYGAMYFMTGTVINLVSSVGTIFTANTVAGSNEFDISYVGSMFQIKNKYASTKSLKIMALRVRDSA